MPARLVRRLGSRWCAQYVNPFRSFFRTTSTLSAKSGRKRPRAIASFEGMFSSSFASDAGLSRGTRRAVPATMRHAEPSDFILPPAMEIRLVSGPLAERKTVISITLMTPPRAAVVGRSSIDLVHADELRRRILTHARGVFAVAGQSHQRAVRAS